MKNYLKKLFKNSDAAGKPSKKAGYIIVIGLIGLLLIILSNVFSTAGSDDNDSTINIDSNETNEQSADETFSNNSSKTSDVDEIEAGYEEDLQEMLNQIQGVSNTEVMVNLESTRVKIYEKNLISGQQITEETDTNGGTRDIEDTQEESQVVLVNQGDKEVPLLVRTEKPDVRGVFIVAEGVDHASVEQRVVEAISRVLDAPVHRVSVMPKN
ncbi:stage III sporulation protein AG [Lentibacillus amyloliquefaciens]|uniref:Stage III sporulation protein AG n=1 Tax=Lentibacillus amyloliquefaciens TaxID=1472767 RepID=A0A0U3W4E0_9BACI|nr:stage III sporulation protein AG [Lentibacillus amyloliquefaciens]ALX48048.1 stage III sporulation protein AG [Lentibacillus amyloliquefaciens]